MLLGKEACEQQAVAERIDASRNTAREHVYLVEAPALETRVSSPSDMLQTVLDVALRFVFVERSQVIRRNDALAKLLHILSVHHRAQLRLADQKALQQCLVFQLKIGQHAQFLDRLRREILRFVDDKQGALAIDGQLAEKSLQRSEQDGLADRPNGKPEGNPDGAQDVVGVESRADELRRNDLGAIELLEQAADDRRLAGTDLSGDDDETLALVKPVLEICERALVPSASEEKRRIRVELEGLACQPIEGFVHRTATGMCGIDRIAPQPRCNRYLGRRAEPGTGRCH